MTNQPNTTKILYIDDDHINRKLISHHLEQQGFTVRTAKNGQEGIEIAREWLPNLILTDLMMPVMDGFQATETLRADPITQDIPIVAFTAMTEASVQIEAQKIGINCLIPKLSSLNDLLKTLRIYLPSTE